MKKIKLLILFIITLQTLSPLWAQHDYNYIPYRKGNKWGYCDSTKKILIKPAYDKVGEAFYIKKMYSINTKFSDVGKENKFTVVINKNKEGVIDTTGTLIIPCKYQYFNLEDGINTITFMAGRAKFSYNVSDKTTIKLYDYDEMDDLKERKIDVISEYYKPEKVKKGLVKVIYYKPEKVKNKYIYRRADSITVKADAVIFQNKEDTIFRIKDKNKWGLASFTQNIFLPAKYDSLIVVIYPKIYALKEGNNWIIYDKTNNAEKFTIVGNDFFKVMLHHPLPFLTKRGAKFGILDNKFNTILPFEYDSLIFHSSNFSVMAGKVSDKWRIYDMKSNQPIDTNIFDEVRLNESWDKQFLVKKEKTWYIYTGEKGMEYIYPHLEPYYRYIINFGMKRIWIFDKSEKSIGCASFTGLNYWDD